MERSVGTSKINEKQVERFIQFYRFLRNSPDDVFNATMQLTRVGILPGRKLNRKQTRQAARILHEQISKKTPPQTTTEKEGRFGLGRERTTTILNEYKPPTIQDNPIEETRTTFWQGLFRRG